MRRRVLAYYCGQTAKTIHFPVKSGPGELNELVSIFRPLVTLSGEVTFAEDGRGEWVRIQDENRERLAKVAGQINRTGEVLSTLLAEEGSHTLKVAMVFAACRAVVSGKGSRGLQLDAETLKIANEHVRQCMDTAMYLENVSARHRTRDDADAILAKIRSDFDDKVQLGGDAILLTKTELTARYASHPNRSRSLTAGDLYDRIIPDLIKRDLCKEYEKKGNKTTYAFRIDEE